MKHSLAALFISATLFAAPAALAGPQDAHAGHDHSQHSDGAHSAPELSAQIKSEAFTAAPDDHIIGQVDAPVTMIVYASVTCPHCAQWFAEDYPVLKRDYLDTGKARMVFREFPTAPGPVAVAGFMIANCSGDQFIDSISYQMAQQQDTLAALQAAEGEDDIMAVFTGIGAQTGLTADETLACISDNSGIAKIERSMSRARAAQISGVPAISVGTTMYTLGDTSAGPLSTVIDKKLANN